MSKGDVIVKLDDGCPSCARGEGVAPVAETTAVTKWKKSLPASLVSAWTWSMETLERERRFGTSK